MSGLELTRSIRAEPRSIRVYCTRHMSPSQSFVATSPPWPHTSAKPYTYLGNSSPCSLSHPHSLQPLSLSSSSHGGALPSSPPLSTLPFAGASPEHDTDELLHPGFIFFLGARSFSKLFLHLTQAPSKRSKFELHQVISSILEVLLRKYLTQVSPSPFPAPSPLP